MNVEDRLRTELRDLRSPQPDPALVPGIVERATHRRRAARRRRTAGVALALVAVTGGVGITVAELLDPGQTTVAAAPAPPPPSAVEPSGAQLPHGDQLPPGVLYGAEGPDGKLEPASTCRNGVTPGGWIVGTVGQRNGGEPESLFGISCFTDPTGTSAGPATYGFSKYSRDADAAAAVSQALDPNSPRPFTGTPTELPWVGDPLPGARLFELAPSAFSDEPTYVAVSVDGPWIMSAEVQSSLPQAPQVAVQGVADTRANLIAAGLVD